MFGEHYREWRTKRLEAVVDHYGADFFRGKSLLELGCGHGHIGTYFKGLGAVVTFSDARIEHLEKVAELNPDVPAERIQHYDAEGPWPFAHFDIIIHMGLLYHLDHWEASLRAACKGSDHLILETEVMDSDDPLAAAKTTESGYDQAFSGVGSRPSPANIERVLTEEGCVYAMVMDARCNSGSHRYDWVSTNSGQHSGGLRRFWFVKGVGVT